MTVGLKNNERFAYAPQLQAVEAKVTRESHFLTEAQLAAFSKAQVEEEAHGECGSECPGYGGARDTFYVGTLKGVGRIYQLTFITWTKVKSPQTKGSVERFHKTMRNEFSRIPFRTKIYATLPELQADVEAWV